MDELIQRLKALSDANRMRIVMMLGQRALCVCELLEVLDISGGTLSNHLKILHNSGLVDQHKDGRWVEYAIKNGEPQSFIHRVTSDYLEKEPFLSDRRKVNSITRLICSSASKNRKYS
ncbi:MAG: metalloregulator ArsR/SmtB family transcription factor [Spirochaetaceae bacterium]|jgi:ArsR family transcriptional regulator|nr:metalloregulator ArsR/SmtB family transcription factor [Spirochaetaceae bacterium]